MPGAGRLVLKPTYPLLVVALVSACNSSSSQSPKLPDGVTALTSTDPAAMTSDADLQPLVQMIGDATVVGLGESQHTSGGFHDVKSRLIRYLVENQGFRVFGLETPRLDAQPATDYVATCAGTVDDALKSIFPQHASTTMGDLFTWMCQYNQQHASDPVSFYGFDMQDPWAEGAALKAFFMKAAGTDGPTLASNLDLCDGVMYASRADYKAANPSGVATISSDQYMKCKNTVASTKSYLMTNQTALTAATSAAEFTLANMDLRAIDSWEDEAYDTANDVPKSYLDRDQAMADIFMALRALKFPDARTVLWAHNYHLANKVEAATGLRVYGVKGMGSFLKEQLGESYQPFALTGYSVDLDWYMGPKVARCEYLSPPAAADSLETPLHALKQAALLVDLDAQNATKPLLDPNGTYSLGSIDTNILVDMVPHEQYRGLVYVDSSPPMNSVIWGPCP